MPNILEKNLPAPVRAQMITAISAGLGLFLGLQYNDFLNNLIGRLFPDSDSLFIRFVIIIVLTFLVVYGLAGIKKALDGK